MLSSTAVAVVLHFHIVLEAAVADVVPPHSLCHRLFGSAIYTLSGCFHRTNPALLCIHGMRTFTTRQHAACDRLYVALESILASVAFLVVSCGTRSCYWSFVLACCTCIAKCATLHLHAAEETLLDWCGSRPCCLLLLYHEANVIGAAVYS